MCLRRPEMPDEPHGRCEACLKAKRRVYLFRLRPTSSGLQISAGELSPRALRERIGPTLQQFSGRPTVKPHLDSTKCELVVAGSRLESVRISPGLASKADEVLTTLQDGSHRTEAAW